MHKLKSMKFWFFCFILVSASVFLPLKQISGTQWVELVTWVLGGYFLANVAMKWTKAAARRELREKLKSVKFWATTGVIISATVFLPAGLITSVQWVAVMKYIGNGYFIANVINKKISKI
ncbi:MAG: hypothetical protein KAW12_07320 [Candidatus Aminicenantes bacterium]|nr:hypothetical protein [Candidatus Aminicenantes bacterium]